MDRQDEETNETSDRRSRGTTLRFAGAGLASVLAFGVPMDGGGGVSAGGPSLLTPARLPGFTTLPSGWPGPSPDLRNPLEADVWSMVYAACGRHGILDEAVTMYHVLWEESRLTPNVRSRCGRYYGIGQFTLPTFRYNVEAMRRLGLIWGDEEWSPYRSRPGDRGDGLDVEPGLPRPLGALPPRRPQARRGQGRRPSKLTV